MVRTIVKDVLFLRQKAEPATKADIGICMDLLDTLKANEAHCVGMAANMIGEKKAIIVVNMTFTNVIMNNPKIISKSKPFETEEGCLSLTGTRKTTRFTDIEVEYYDINWNKQRQKYTGWIAQIIQHECDHLEGIII